MLSSSTLDSYEELFSFSACIITSHLLFGFIKSLSCHVIFIVLVSTFIKAPVKSLFPVTVSLTFPPFLAATVLDRKPCCNPYMLLVHGHETANVYLC